MQLAPAGHVEGFCCVRVAHPEGDVLEGLPHQAVPEVAGGDILPSRPAKGGVVDGEGHLHGGGRDLHEGQGLGVAGGADGVPDGDVPDAGHGDDVPGGGLGDGDPARPSNWYRLTALALRLCSGSWKLQTEMSWFWRMVPRSMRPMAMRPTNSL